MTALTVQRPTARAVSLLRLALLVAGLCLVAWPMYRGGFLAFQAAMVLTYGIAIMGLVLLTGMTGLISLGQGAFFAIGAYCTAIMLDSFGLPYWAAIPMSAAVTFILGFLVGIPAVRLEGIYLALATFSLAIAVPQLLKYKGFSAWTGGFQGIVLDSPDVPGFLQIAPDRWLYLVVLVVAAIMYLLSTALLAGRYGRALEAIREQPTAAVAMGVNVQLVKAQVFAISAMYAGVAGALSVLLTQFVSPDGYHLFLSITLLVGAVIGGVTSVVGAFFGAIFVVFIPNFSESISKAIPWAIYGCFLIASVYIAPRGAYGLYLMLVSKIESVGKKPQGSGHGGGE